MAWKRTLERARVNLDGRLTALQPVDQHLPPGGGWIRAIRKALGLTAAQLGGRLGIRPQSLEDLEKSEAAGTISLDTMRRVAEAMDCTLVYALVPKVSLEATVQRRAERIAQAAISGVSHSMALEDQAVPDALQQSVRNYIQDHISERDLWRE